MTSRESFERSYGCVERALAKMSNEAIQKTAQILAEGNAAGTFDPQATGESEQ